MIYFANEFNDFYMVQVFTEFYSGQIMVIKSQEYAKSSYNKGINNKAKIFFHKILIPSPLRFALRPENERIF